MNRAERLGASFRDPSGFLFWREGVLLRQVNASYREPYDQLRDSGLYEDLVARDLLVPHEELDEPLEPGAYRCIRPEPIPFISYPYEWSFSQLQDAALATLEIQKRALGCGMTLKDASAYNIQFRRGKPLLIDTLSFEIYREGEPWIAYRQFCQHFLAPLALMSHTDVRLAHLLRVFIDGVPLDLASRLLPRRTRLRFSLLMHLHLHARSQKRHEDSGGEGGERARSARVSRNAMQGLVESLESAVRSLRFRTANTEWGDYYDATNYSEAGATHKGELVRGFLEQSKPSRVWDLGANTGVFSRIALELGADVVSFDIDPVAVEKNYLRLRDEGPATLLPLVLDLTNPSSGIGWANQERMSVTERGPADVVMALALIHHLAISNNVPLEQVASFLAGLGRRLILEWVPKEDSQVRRLLATREDIFDRYTREGFEEAFATSFEVVAAEPIADTERVLYLLEARG